MFPYSDVPFLRNNSPAVVFSAIYIFRQKIPGKIFGAHLGFSLQVFHSYKTRVIVLALPSNMM
jgi:hypothetical protein